MNLTRTSLLVLAFSLCACGDSGGDSSFGDVESSTTPGTTATTASTTTSGGESTTTGGSYQCDANVEFAFGDGVELGATSVDAIRREIAGDVQYVIVVHGDDAGTNELDITFNALPVAGMEYQATALMQFGQPIVALLPAAVGMADFEMGTVTYTTVGVAEGDVLAAEFHLEFMRGTIEGCIQHPLVIETM